MPKTIEGNAFGVLDANQDSPECFRRHGSRGPRQMAQLFAFHPSAIETIPRGYRPLVYVLDGRHIIHDAGTEGTFAELTAESVLAEASAPTDP
jgi:hypothetical protein